MENKTSKTAALKAAQGLVGKITSHGQAGYGKQWFFSSPADLSDLISYNPCRSFHVETKTSFYTDTRAMRSRRVAEIALVLMGLDAEDCRRAVDKVWDLQLAPSAASIVNSVLAS